MKKLFTLISVIAFVFLANAQQSDDCNGCTPQPLKPGLENVQNSAKGLIYDNGDFVTNGINSSDPDSSVLQGANTTLGGGFKMGLGFSIADDFTIATGSWVVDSVIIFAYQTNSATSPSTFDGFYVRIWDGDPASGGTVVWGDTTASILSNSYWSNVYRGSIGAWGTTRPIMYVVGTTTALTLTAGTYWIDVQATGTGTSGPWCVPSTILGVEASGDAYQRIGQTYGAWLDDASGAPLGLPFKVYGSVISNVEENETNINIYPNPAKSIINIEVGEEINKIVIYDQMGNAVNTIETPGTSASIETDNMTPGMYHILIETQSGISSTKIIVE